MAVIESCHLSGSISGRRRCLLFFGEKVIIEGRFITENDSSRKQVEVDRTSNTIVKVGLNLGMPDLVIDDNSLIFPSFIDIHTHCREDVSGINNYKEDFYTASMSAINGGVGVIADMPNNPVLPVDDKSYKDKLALCKASQIPVVLYGLINSKTKPLNINIPYKFFMGPTTGMSDNQTDFNFLRFYKGKSVSFHCEDSKLFTDSKIHHEARPAISEIESVKEAIRLIERYGLRGIICHISTKEALLECIDAKKRNVDVMVEVTPHHLLFSNEEFGTDFRFQVNPPIRSSEDAKFLLQSLRDGHIDFVATDHAPHLMSEKKEGMSGMPGLDTYGLVMGLLIKKYNVSENIIFKVACLNPGKWISEYLDKPAGKIQEGYAASFTILDFSKEHTVTKENILTKCGWSPFENIIFPLSVKTLGRF